MFGGTFYPCLGGVCISVRNMNSIQVFANAQFKMGYLSDFQNNYLSDIIQQNIMHTLPKSCRLGCNRLVCIDTDAATCLKRIVGRIGQLKTDKLGHYLNRLQQAYE